MSDWLQIDGRELHARVKGTEPLEVLAGSLVIDRLPFAFDNKEQYFTWRHQLGEGIEVDPRDIVIVGSCAIGVSLNGFKRYRPFGSHSDVDIAVISNKHFEVAWSWFRRADPVVLGFDEKGRQLFDKHRSHYIYEGVVASNYFLSNLPFGSAWSKEMQRSERFLPSRLRGRALNVRIYKDSEALRLAQIQGLKGFRTFLETRGTGGEAS